MRFKVVVTREGVGTALWVKHDDLENIFTKEAVISIMKGYLEELEKDIDDLHKTTSK